MLTADFRHIALADGRRNGERLFRAAISAFCTLARPTRREIAQLDDLTLGLYESVSAEARRFAAGTLCDCPSPPRGLIRRLCDEPAGISAPLLIRSRALSDIDLIALIGRHGLSHARVIARRDALNPVIAALVRALAARAGARQEQPADERPDGLEPVRVQLRALMRNEPETGRARLQGPLSGADCYAALLDPALSGDGSAFTAALARALDLPPVCARSLAASSDHWDLMMCLKAAQLSAEQVFLLIAATHPAQVADPAAIRLFLQRFHAMSENAAREKVDEWRKAGDGNLIQLPLASVR